MINQKEYLKKYLSSGNSEDKKKKKKKKIKVVTKTVKIIDDDIDLKNMKPAEDNGLDIFIDREDAPQIVGIFDERGPVDFSDQRRWKSITDNLQKNQATNRSENKNEVNWSGDDEAKKCHKKNEINDSSSNSYHRKSENENVANSPLRHKKRKDSEDSDASPPRRSNRKDNGDSDLSPPRRRNRKNNEDSDVSPLRRRSKKDNEDSDLSPPRRRKRKDSEDSDLSPPRRRRRKDSEESDLSPPRHRRDNDDGGRRHKSDHYRKHSYSPTHSHHRRHRSDKHYKPSNGEAREKDRTREKNKDDSERQEGRMKKTLDGKTAGLQDARALREETEAFKKREAEHFRKLSKEVTGVGQAAIVRDSKTGRRRDLEAEAAEKREKQKQQQELDEKYSKWGKGLKQVESQTEKLKDDLYEMSKPLARYADDADLDKRLREQERDGDPMLEYIKQKQIKEGKRKPDRPRYEGSFMPNRFGIKPGHRWDGVDRSNGYEKRWFEAQSAKIALQEEAYKWSTSDM